jgi:beta-phosphoglucomutase-like phosphatase (HAD superfamily)
MKIKAVLLDLDGTLIDSVPLIMKSDEVAINKFGFKVTHQKLRELSMLHSRDIAYFLMDSSKRVFDLFEFIDFRRKTFLRLLKKRGARKLWFRDSKQFIKGMSEKFPVAVVTGSRHLFVNEVFDEKTKKCLRFIITSDDVEHKKPDVEPLIFALRKLKLRKQDVVLHLLIWGHVIQNIQHIIQDIFIEVLQWFKTSKI